MLKTVYLVAACFLQAFAGDWFLPDPLVIDVKFDYCACLADPENSFKQYTTLHNQFFNEVNKTHFGLLIEMEPKVKEMCGGKCDYDYWKKTNTYEMSYDTVTASGLFPLKRTYDPNWNADSKESLCGFIAIEGPKLIARITIDLPMIRSRRVAGFTADFIEGYYKNWKECNEWNTKARR